LESPATVRVSGVSGFFTFCKDFLHLQDLPANFMPTPQTHVNSAFPLVCLALAWAVHIKWPKRKARMVGQGW
jgi:hypothetical protein